MNIFYLDHDLVKCAQYHNNKHCVKMIVEYAQLLSTTHRILDGKEIIVEKLVNNSYRYRKEYILENSYENIILKATHINHPCAIWTRNGSSNYTWLARLLHELSEEYTFRYGKEHLYKKNGLIDILKHIPKNIPVKEFYEPPCAMSLECIVENNVVESYKKYYIVEKQHLANWKGKIGERVIPEWYNVKTI